MIVFSLPPGSSAAERNWSLQDFIFSLRRNRLTGFRGTQLVSIYWNLRALNKSGEFVRRSPPIATDVTLAGWRSRALAPKPNFPHPDASWKPNSNWANSDAGNFKGLHGDESNLVGAGPEDEEVADDDDAEDNIQAQEWSGAAAALLRKVPDNVPDDLKQGDRIVVWFGTPWHDWFVGEIVRVDLRLSLPVIALFQDGEASLALDPELYGVKSGNQWALLQAKSPPLPFHKARPAGLAGSNQSAPVVLDDDVE